MRKLLVAVSTCMTLILFSCFKTSAQCTAPNFTMSLAFHDTTLACSTPCLRIFGSATNLQGTADYTVSSIPFAPPGPFSDPSVPGLVNPLCPGNQDDKFFNTSVLPFSFCFYDSTYSKFVVGTNGLITFDTSNAYAGNTWMFSPTDQIPTAGTGNIGTGTCPSVSGTVIPRAAIMGPYYDIDIDYTTSPTRKMEYRVDGVAPNRRAVITFFQIPLFQCSSVFGSHQIILYECSNVIETYILNKPNCLTWNNNLGILGIQNWARNKAVAAPGKNCTSWSESLTAYRFTPAGGSLLRRVELVTNNTVVAIADTATSGGLLNFSFNNFCPVLDSAKYYVRTIYQLCGGGSQIVLTDSLIIKKSSITVSTIADQSVCAGGQITLTTNSSSATATYTWTGTGLSNPNAQSPVATLGTTPVQYIVTATNGVCSAKDTVNIGVNVVTVNTITDASVCSGKTITLTTTGTPGATYTWNPTSGLDNPNAQSPVATITGNIQYTVNAQVGPCSAQDIVNIAVAPSPAVDAGPTITAYAGNQAQLLGTADPGTYSWTPPDALNNPNSLTPYVINPQQTTLYTLQVTNAQGCIATDTATLLVIKECINVMNAFSPNNDGIHDTWHVTDDVSCTKNITVGIYNRYGSRVYESKDYKNDWKGTYGGKPLPDGTYYYVVTIILLNDQKVLLQGDVTILR